MVWDYLVVIRGILADFPRPEAAYNFVCRECHFTGNTIVFGALDLCWCVRPVLVFVS